MILLIDALDSFTYNLVQAFQALGEEVDVARFDQIDLDGVRARNPEFIVLSPGPGHPTECKIHMDIAASDLDIPVFGVCLGQQALAAGSGGRVTHAREPLHGEATPVEHDGTGVFAGLPQPLMVGRYHSLIVDDASLPQEWEITARSTSGEPMAMAHRTLPRWGVQFHPESILTPDGPALLANVLRLSGLRT
ncbi:anthranilate synthase component II [Solilutibacter silvestris]|uniref:Glutamine amidotransferase/aminodeoxychorismate synthase n=1 Tax=Solilutibacter silvestris TaxID=1645665 RepID=A0A2K1PXF0_9GAMM|nr:aminodeoxychorismate/anthranilate synthase component II [Lysobacter silvestris]PNS07465.1 glutamine amidotransferase/aminodeoxychorismate synthase [Lysobacter silvestris]